MMPEQIERVFGRGRLKMATGEHVEVFREAVGSSERRRYTKRFLATGDTDFRQWTEREWRILARLIGHGIRCVPDVVQFDGGAAGGMRQVQTYDAGVTVDQWATLLPVARDGVARTHVFEDCAHWWALAHHCLVALDEIHALQLVHLDIKADNICIPYGPPGFDVDAPDHRLHVVFERLALIDFAFSLVSRERLATALPIGWQKDYDYQSPRLLRALEAGRSGDLRPTQELDWRCDLYSLAAMLRRYLPDDEWARAQGVEAGWTARRYDDARALIYRLRDCHDRDDAQWRPHQELIESTGVHLGAPSLARSLADGWSLARDPHAAGAVALVTPMTRIAVARIAPTAATFVSRPIVARAPTPAVIRKRPVRSGAVAPGIGDDAVPPPMARRRISRWAIVASTLAALAAVAAPSIVGDPQRSISQAAREAVAALRATFDPPADTSRMQASAAPEASSVAREQPATMPAEATPARSEAPADPATPSTDVPAPASSTPDAPREPPRVVVEKSGRAATAPALAPAQRASRERSSPASRPRAAPVQPIARPHVPPLQLAKAAPPAPARAPAPPETPAMPRPAESDAQAATVTAPVVETPAAPIDVSRSSSSTTDKAPVVASMRVGSAAAVAPMESVRPESPTVTATPAAAPKPSRRDAWRNAFHDVLKLFGAVEQRPAPVDERSAQAPRKTTVVPRPPSPPVEAPRPPSPPVEAPLPRVPQNTEPPTLMARAAPPLAQPQAAVPPDFVLSPVPRPPALVHARAATLEGPDDDLAVQGRRMLADAVPRIAAQARSDATRVLWTAAVADYPAQDRTVVDSTYVPWRSERADALPPIRAARARQLHDEARHAFTAGRDNDAVDLGLRALAANPRDADVAGFLAYLHLRTTPAQPETARQLALYALAFSGSTRSERLDDWNTLAIASALTGKEVDATQAFLVELALSADTDRSCREALRAYATFGERLRVPVETLLRRIYAQRRGYDAMACAWPAYRTAAR
jgi:hypothetical protein